MALCVLLCGFSLTTCTNPLRPSIEDFVAAHRQVTGDGVIYVCAASGSDANPGLPNKPKRTIQAAIAFMKENGLRGEVRVAEGNYLLPEGVSIVVPEGVSLYGGYQQGTWVRDFDTYHSKISKDPQTIVITVQFEPDVTRSTVVDGFVIEAGAGVETMAVVINNASPTIRNNTISGFGALEKSWGVMISEGSPLIEWNMIFGGAGADESTGISITTGSTAVIRNNAIAPGVRGNTIGIGIRVVYSSPRIERNTIISEETGGSQTIGLWIDGGSPEVYANVIEGGGGSTYSLGMLIDSTGTPRIISNAIHGGWSSGHSSRGIEIDGGATPVIRNNTISSGTNPNRSECLFSWSGASAVDNNVFFSEATSGLRTAIWTEETSGRPSMVRHNAFIGIQYLYVYPDPGSPGSYLGTTTVIAMQTHLSGAGVPAFGNVEPSQAITTVLVDVTQPRYDGWELSTSAPASVVEGGLTIVGEPYPYDRREWPRTVPWSIGAYERD